MAKADAFILSGQTVDAGAAAVVRIPLPRLYTMRATPEMQVHIVNGAKPGPKMLLTSALHGDELNGIEVVRRVLSVVDASELRGTLIAIPIVNIFGVVQYSRYLPDGRDLNRTFPGTSGGSMASRLANVLFDDVVQHCDVGIDIHTAGGHRANLPQVRADLEIPELDAMARSFGVPVVINSRGSSGTLRREATNRGIPFLLFEGGTALRFDELAIASAVSGIRHVMAHLNMLDEAETPAAEPFVAQGTRWIRAPESGVYHSSVALGQSLQQGDQIGDLRDPADCFSSEHFAVKCPEDGLVIGQTQIPLVNAGDALLHLATFNDSNMVADEVDDYHASLAHSDLPAVNRGE